MSGLVAINIILGGIGYLIGDMNGLVTGCIIASILAML